VTDLLTPVYRSLHKSHYNQSPRRGHLVCSLPQLPDRLKRREPSAESRKHPSQRKARSWIREFANPAVGSPQMRPMRHLAYSSCWIYSRELTASATAKVVRTGSFARKKSTLCPLRKTYLPPRAELYLRIEKTSVETLCPLTQVEVCNWFMRFTKSECH
jgi:hypothetical protein